MNFQKIGPVEGWQAYLDNAFSSASDRVSQLRSQKKGMEPISKSILLETTRIQRIVGVLTKSFDKIVRDFPRVDDLDRFYRELIQSTIGIDEYKKSLGAVNWAKNHIKLLSNEQRNKIRRTDTPSQVNKHRIAFSGRMSATVRKIRKELAYLEKARKIMKRYPDIKTDRPSVVIAGFPNVGKSTILAKLTKTAPKIASYPFTTQHLNVAIDKGVQYIDTPGLLDRPIKERNPIEKHAILALKHIGKLVVFVFDPSDNCGYSVEEQENLLKDIKKTFGLPVIRVSNKVDIVTPLKGTIGVSAKTNEGIKELKQAIMDKI